MAPCTKNDSHNTIVIYRHLLMHGQSICATVYPSNPTTQLSGVHREAVVGAQGLGKASFCNHNTNGLRRPAPCIHRSPPRPCMGHEGIHHPLAYSTMHPCVHPFMQPFHAPRFRTPSQVDQVDVATSIPIKLPARLPLTDTSPAPWHPFLFKSRP
jgi:hypothetical protein